MAGRGLLSDQTNRRDDPGPRLVTVSLCPRPDFELLRVLGELDAVRAPQLRVQLLAGARRRSVRLLVLDLVQVHAYAPSGLAILADGLDRASHRGVEVRMVTRAELRDRLVPLLRSNSRCATYRSVGAALATGPE